MSSFLICCFTLASLVIGFAVSHNADKLLQETCHLSTCQI